MSPFDKARYERLLEGLEATEVLFSALNDERRIDAQYFRKRYLAEDASRKHYSGITLGEVAFITDGPHGYHIVDESSNVAMLTAKCAKNWFADRSQAEVIHVQTHNANQRSSLEVNDLILSTRGTVGACALVEPDALPANIDQDVARISIRNDAPVSPRYVLTYLNSSFGQDWIERNATGMVQQGLSLSKVRELPVPILSSDFQDKIDGLILEASSARSNARYSLQQAEHTLLQALGLDAWTPPEALSYVRSSGEAFAAGRFDAEYFHPAKAQALVDLHALSDVCVGDLFDSIRDLWQPTEAAGLPVRNYDLTDALDPFLDPSKPTTAPEEIASTKKCIAAGDLVVSRLRSYLQEIAVVLPSDDGITAVASTEFIVLRPKKEGTLSVEALLIYLRSQLPQIVFKWSQDGSNHPRFDERELLNLPVPRVLISDHANYETAVREMVAQRQRAASLLDAAKRAVEIAIEESEPAALRYLRNVL
jgi:hypothetical protein